MDAVACILIILFLITKPLGFSGKRLKNSPPNPILPFLKKQTSLPTLKAANAD
jgi:hypothetical protein